MDSCPGPNSHEEGSQGPEVGQRHGTETEIAPVAEDAAQPSSKVKKEAPKQILPESVWENAATLDWRLHIVGDVELHVGTSLQVSAKVKGPQPEDRMLLVVEPIDR